MALNDFTPSGDSPREGDDSVGIKDALSAALAKHDADAVEATEDDEGEEVVVAEPEVKAGEKTADEDKATPADKTAKEPEVKAGEKAADKKVDEQPKPGEAPANWSAEDKTLFGTLSKPAQDFLLKRHTSMEADYTRKTQDLAGIRKEYEAVDAVFAPHREGMKKANVTSAQLIQGWAAAEAQLMAGNGLDFLPNVAKTYRLDPVKLAYNILVTGGVADPKAALEQLMGDAAEKAKNTPPPVQLPPEILAKLQRVDQIDAHLRGQEEQRLNSEVTRIDAELSQFKAAADATGALLHPHYDELVDTMAQLVGQLSAQKLPIPPLDQLYQDAIFANPAVRQKWLDAKLATERSSTVTAQQAERDKAADAARAKAKKARAAGSSVTGSMGSGQPIEGKRANGSIRDSINAAVEDSESVIH